MKEKKHQSSSGEEALKAQGSFAIQALNKEDLCLLHRHLDDHKYWMNQNQPEEVTWEEAVNSWLDKVWKPLSHAVEQREYLGFFPEKRSWDLYLEISEHWHYLKEDSPEISMQEAVNHYAASLGRYQKSPGCQPRFSS